MTKAQPREAPRIGVQRMWHCLGTRSPARRESVRISCGLMPSLGMPPQGVIWVFREGSGV